MAVLQGVTLKCPAGSLTVLLTASLPAASRRILGAAAAGLLTDALPRAADAACVAGRAFIRPQGTYALLLLW